MVPSGEDGPNKFRETWRRLGGKLKRLSRDRNVPFSRVKVVRLGSKLSLYSQSHEITN